MHQTKIKNKKLKNNISGCYCKTFSILQGDFELTVILKEPNIVETQIIEVETGELYTLHLSNEEGDFVGKIRAEYNKIIENIILENFENCIFKSKYTYKVIDYIYKKYYDNPEYLWVKFPDNAVIRRKDNSKWYIVILTVAKNRLGIDSDEKVEVLNLRVKPEVLPELLEHENIYPAYHMNKKHWISIILDGSVPLKEILKFIDTSYLLAK